MNNYDYAKLGESCQTSMRILASNTKFFPVSSALYEKPFTLMYQYPNEEDRNIKPPRQSMNCCGKKS